jgi:hypothetical protein
MVTNGNDITDQLAIKCLTAYPFLGPEPACNNSEKAKWFIRKWMKRRHQKFCKYTLGQKHVNSFPQEPF